MGGRQFGSAPAVTENIHLQAVIQIGKVECPRPAGRTVGRLFGDQAILFQNAVPVCLPPMIRGIACNTPLIVGGSILQKCNAELFEIVIACGGMGPSPGLLQSGKKHGSKYGDNDYPAGAEFLTFSYSFFLIIKQL